MGTPLKQEVIDMNPEYNMTELSKFPNIKKTEWKNVFSIINSGSQNQRPSLSRLGP